MDLTLQHLTESQPMVKDVRNESAKAVEIDLHDVNMILYHLIRWILNDPLMRRYKLALINL